jgi:hypothetical protein
MEMKKKRIVYSLTGRGLFSELSNLALALVYADYNQEELTVNTRTGMQGWRKAGVIISNRSCQTVTG